MSFHTRRDTAARHDHERDLRKHDSLPHRVDRKISTALDIALLCRLLDNIQEAADLIEQYAKMVASEARLDATVATSDRIIAVIERPHAQT